MARIIVIAGPNGAGKTTSAVKLLPETMHCREFVNADLIASGLSTFEPDSVAMQAGRLMLERIKELARTRIDFAFETTLAASSFAPFLRQARAEGYRVSLLSLWLPSVELALRRVASRVRSGGHVVPDPVVRRRYGRGLQNLFRLYMPLVDDWTSYNGSDTTIRRIAFRRGHDRTRVECIDSWKRIQGQAQEIP